MSQAAGASEPARSTDHRAPRPRANPGYSVARVAFHAAVSVYFRRIEVRNAERVPRTGPVLIVANHPAGLTDAVVLATQLERHVHFLAMSPLFRPWIRGVLMRAIGALPVYRQRDDPSQMHLNDDTFKACHELFDRGGVVLIFPEGHSDEVRRVLQLKTGAARLAIGQSQRGGPAGPLTLVPVGLYFEDRTRFRSEIILSIGEPIPLEPHVARAASEPREAVQALTQLIQARIESLIQVIPEREMEGLVLELEKLYLPELQARGDPRHALELKRRVAACVDFFRRTDPERVVAVARQMKHYLRTLHVLHLHDAAVREIEARGDWRRTHLRRCALALAGLPPAAVGAALHWFPYEACSRAASRFAPHPTSISSAHIVAGLAVFPAWWSLLAAAGWRLTGRSPSGALVILFVVVGLGLFAAAYMRWWERQPGFVRMPVFASSRRHRLLRVALERRELIRIFDQARADFLAREAESR